MQFDINKQTMLKKIIADFTRKYPDGKKVFAWWPVKANEKFGGTEYKFVWLETVTKTLCLGASKNYYVASCYTYI